MSLPRPLSSYGTSARLRTLTSNAPMGDFVRVNDLPHDSALTLRVQIQGSTGGGSPSLTSTGGAAVVTVTEGTDDGASFVRRFYASPVEQRVRVSGRLVAVSAEFVTFTPGGVPTVASSPPPATSTLALSCALTDAPIDPLGDLQPVWFTTPQGAAGAGEDARFTGAATILDVALSLSSLGGAAALWLWIFDGLTVAAAAAAGQPSLIPPPMLTAVGQNFNYGDDVRPGASFGTGLSWGLSTTQNTFTQAIGATARFDWKGGF